MAEENLILTLSDRLFITRRRLNETQMQAAKRLGVCLATYSSWERDVPSTSSKIPLIKLDVKDLKPHEKCVLYRRKANFSQHRVAKDLNMCRYYIHKMELGAAPCDALLWYWEQ